MVAQGRRCDVDACVSDNECLGPSIAEKRLETTAKNPANARRGNKRVADFELDLEVEAIIDVALLSELLASVTDLCRKFHGMADSRERI